MCMLTVSNINSNNIHTAKLQYSMTINNNRKRRTEVLLPFDFQPCPNTVIIGKGKLSMQSIGNRRLRIMVKNRLQDYRKATSKLEKSTIVTSILSAIEKDCPSHGAFVSHDGLNFREATEHQAREKIASSFRNLLSEKYKSSSKNKVAQRRLARKREKEQSAKLQPFQLCNIPTSFSPTSSTTRRSSVVTPVPYEIADNITGEEVAMPLSSVRDQDNTLSLSSLLREPIHSLRFDNEFLNLSEEFFGRSFFGTVTEDEHPISLDDNAAISLSKDDLKFLLEGF